MQSLGGKAATAAWLMINATLALILWFQVDAAPRVARAEVQATAPVSRLQLPEGKQELQPLSAYQELNERPLFWAERRALQETVPIAPDGKPAQMPFTLLGVVRAARQAHAVLGRSGSKEVNRVYVGDVIEGWVIESMTQNSVTVNSNGIRHELQFGSGRPNGK